MPLWLTIITFFLIGFLLLIIELAIIPGFGFSGILGIIALGIACYSAFINLSPLAGVISTLASITIIFLLFKILPNTPLWKKIRLSLTQNKNTGYQVGNPETQNLLNRTGTALTMLHPCGTALIDDTRYDVIADGEFINKNEKIIVVKIDGNNIVVKKSDVT